MPDCPEIPEAAYYLWPLFWELNEIRRPAEGGTAPLLPGDIDKHLELSGESLGKIEYQFIRAMDRAFVSEVAKELKAKREEAEQQRNAKTKR